MNYNKTGQHFKATRLSRGLTPQRLAAQVGYRNVNRGANRILAFESQGVITKDLFSKLITGLSLDPDHVRALVEEDRRAYYQAWEDWASQPVEPQLVFRTSGPCIWFHKSLPAGLTKEQAVAFTKGLVAQSDGFTYVLIWSRKEEVWFYPNRHVCERTRRAGAMGGPYNTLRGGKSHFILRQTE